MSDDLLAKHSKAVNASTRALPGPRILPGLAGSPRESTGRRVLVVDSRADRRAGLRSILDSSYEVVEASSTGEALLVLSDLAIDLALVDYKTPELGGAGFCSVLGSYHRTRSIPTILIADAEDAEFEAVGLTAGAEDFLIRPVSNLVLTARVRSVMRRRTMLESADDLESLLLSLAQTVEARDPATGRHCHRVSLLCSALGATLGLSPAELVNLQRGAFLHDIGKIAIPDRILFKRGPLSPEEWTVMKDHTLFGERICAGMKMLAEVLPIIRSHHERWDGSGYPDGLRQNDIPLAARIVQVADIYDALTTDRPYKPAFAPDFAIKIIRDESAIGWRDARIVEAFCDTAPRLQDLEAISNSSLLALSVALGNSSGLTASPGASAESESKAQHKQNT
jgi:putative two-component system response regulator